MIEDYTMRGVDDLRNRVARTPLAPLETFREDPLRLLRTVRFATRYDCRIVPDIMVAANDPGIELFLSRKVSRERIGVEFLKMAQSHDFSRAVELLEEMNILNSVFNIEGDNSNYLRTQKNRSMEEFNNTLFLISVPAVRHGTVCDLKSSVNSITTLDAKYMNSYFATMECDCTEYRVAESEEDRVLMNGSHRYFSFIRERVLQGVQLVHEGEAWARARWMMCSLMKEPAIQRVWTEEAIEAIVQPIEDVRSCVPADA